MTNLTQKDLDALCHILTAEEMAYKKAKIYANTLTDALLAGEMERIALKHAERFSSLYALMGGKA